MFYTLVSRTIITKINTSRDYFYIFLLGSVGYVVLHWYLHMEKREGIVEKAREYLYYAMVLDLIIAYVWMMFSPVKSDKKSDSDNDDSNEQKPAEKTYTPEERKMITQRMQEARRLQQLRQKELADQRAGANSNSGKPNPQTKNSQDDNPEDDTHTPPDPKKSSIFSKSEAPKETDQTQTQTESQEAEQLDPQPPTKTKGKKKNKKVSERQDTEIPIYEGREKRSD